MKLAHQRPHEHTTAYGNAITNSAGEPVATGLPQLGSPWVVPAELPSIQWEAPDGQPEVRYTVVCEFAKPPGFKSSGIIHGTSK